MHKKFTKHPTFKLTGVVAATSLYFISQGLSAQTLEFGQGERAGVSWGGAFENVESNDINSTASTPGFATQDNVNIFAGGDTDAKLKLTLDVNPENTIPKARVSIKTPDNNSAHYYFDLSGLSGRVEVEAEQTLGNPVSGPLGDLSSVEYIEVKGQWTDTTMLTSFDVISLTLPEPSVDGGTESGAEATITFGSSVDAGAAWGWNYQVQSDHISIDNGGSTEAMPGFASMDNLDLLNGISRTSRLKLNVGVDSANQTNSVRVALGFNSGDVARYYFDMNSSGVLTANRPLNDPDEGVLPDDPSLQYIEIRSAWSEQRTAFDVFSLSAATASGASEANYSLPLTRDSSGSHWYQLQGPLPTYAEVCTTSEPECDVQPGAMYQLINHSVGGGSALFPKKQTVTIPEDGVVTGSEVIRNETLAAFSANFSASYLDPASVLFNDNKLTLAAHMKDLQPEGDAIGNTGAPWDEVPYDKGDGDGDDPNSADDGVAGDGNFRVGCEWSHFSYDDPIISNQPGGGGHLHMFWGNTNTDYTTQTTNDLISEGGGTCNGYAANRSSYWMPALMSGTNTAVVPEEIIIYYKTKTVCDSHTMLLPTCDTERDDPSVVYDPPAINHVAEDVVAMPQGLQLIAGWKVGDSLINLEADGDKSEHIFWSCGSNGGTNEGAKWNHIPTTEQWQDKCATDDYLNATVYFPQCWEGDKNGDGVLSVDELTTANYVADGDWDHVAQVAINEACPSEFDQRMPQLGFLVYWDLQDIGNNTSQLSLSSDHMVEQGSTRGGTLHADWIAGWHKETMDTWVEECLQDSQNCTFGQLSDRYGLINGPEQTYDGHSEENPDAAGMIGEYLVNVPRGHMY